MFQSSGFQADAFQQEAAPEPEVKQLFGYYNQDEELLRMLIPMLYECCFQNAA